jgi:hypothetical protein
MKRILWCLAWLSVLAPRAGAQVQEISFDDQIEITSTTPVAVESISVSGDAPFDAALTAHVYAEGGGFNHDRYQIGICKGNASGAFVGSTLWRPGDKTVARGDFEADTIAVTGFEANVSGPATYVLCVSKFNSDAPDLTLYPRGINASQAPAGTSLRGFAVTDFDSSVPLTSTSLASFGSLVVDAAVASDVLLTAHVRLEGFGLGGGNGYDFGICRGNTSGPMVGRALLRPPSSANGSANQADQITLTGFDPGVLGPVTYVLCGGKRDVIAPNVSVSSRGMHAVTAPAGTTLFGSEQVEVAPSFDLLDSIEPLSSVTVTGTGVYSVRLTGHVYLEGFAFNGASRYAIGICRNDENGPLVGYAYWRPNTRNTDDAFVGDTLALTGYDAHRSGTTTYVLCAGNRDFNPPTATAFQRGLVAQLPEPGGALAFATAASALAALRATRSRRA